MKGEHESIRFTGPFHTDPPVWGGWKGAFYRGLCWLGYGVSCGDFISDGRPDGLTVSCVLFHEHEGLIHEDGIFYVRRWVCSIDIASIESGEIQA